ncbi:hypothetical protein BGZ61DRAFT_514924 [Ilyonectria robusta]|uniref:uncharacterized protein n=1 Tax=Ilyonectria robusta TaxID=1079257 RepID=UPI001E8D4601|nr:uncharacterized protein BGZ61DRAFT_514924 [Ilyonectria robusta]KAH8733657.1 hypothetical protein BGZ61DRAFT_514924 [Ilyonectria robusta]
MAESPIVVLVTTREPLAQHGGKGETGMLVLEDQKMRQGRAQPQSVKAELEPIPTNRLSTAHHGAPRRVHNYAHAREGDNKTAALVGDNSHAGHNFLFVSDPGGPFLAKTANPPNAPNAPPDSPSWTPKREGRDLREGLAVTTRRRFARASLDTLSTAPPPPPPADLPDASGSSMPRFPLKTSPSSKDASLRAGHSQGPSSGASGQYTAAYDLSSQTRAHHPRHSTSRDPVPWSPGSI